MNFKNQKGSIALFVLIALLFYMGFLLLLYANNLNKVQTISEKVEAIKAIYAKNFDNVDDVYNRRLAQNDTMQPTIKEIPNSIITNVTQLNDSYEEYGAMGGNTEYIAFNNKFTSLKEVINYSIQNSLYGTANIVINAYGNNGLLTTENKKIEIVRGMKVANESELNTAFSTTGDLYVYVANNIECTNVISADNINHKLDLNNCTVSYTKQNESFSFITLESNSNLTILDSSTEKNGNLTANLNDETTQSDGKDRKNTICTIQNKGMLTIESGRVSANSVQKILAKNDGTSVNNTSIVINNSGTINIDGGEVYCNIQSGACTYLVVKNATSNGRGINNAGTVNLNSGIITVNAESSMVRGKNATVKGRTYAYSYGIVNSTGTVNNSNNITFNITATANSSGTYSQSTDKGEIVNESQTASG